jgi:hypothetical protein
LLCRGNGSGGSGCFLRCLRHLVLVIVVRGQGGKRVFVAHDEGEGVEREQPNERERRRKAERRRRWMERRVCASALWAGEGRGRGAEAGEALGRKRAKGVDEKKKGSCGGRHVGREKSGHVVEITGDSKTMLQLKQLGKGYRSQKGGGTRAGGRLRKGVLLCVA